MDTVNTNTQRSELEQQNKSERCPITGVSTAPVYVPNKHPGDTLAGSDSEYGGRSNSKLQAMFNKFLYQK